MISISDYTAGGTHNAERKHQPPCDPCRTRDRLRDRTSTPWIGILLPSATWIPDRRREKVSGRLSSMYQPQQKVRVWPTPPPSGGFHAQACPPPPPDIPLACIASARDTPKSFGGMRWDTWMAVATEGGGMWNT